MAKIPGEVQQFAVRRLDRIGDLEGGDEKSGVAPGCGAPVELMPGAFVTKKIDPLSVVGPIRIAQLANIRRQFVCHAVRDIRSVDVQNVTRLDNLEDDLLGVRGPAGIPGGGIVGNLDQVAAIGVGHPKRSRCRSERNQKQHDAHPVNIRRCFADAWT